jgi:hypothetical protein
MVHGGWDDTDLPGALIPEIQDQISEWAEQGMGPPETWTNFDISIDGDNDHVVASMTTDDGYTYSVDIDADLDNDLQGWDWVWEMWDWLSEEFPEVDLDSQYAES